MKRVPEGIGIKNVIDKLTTLDYIFCMKKAMMKRSTHYPLKERAVALCLRRKAGAERLLEGKDAEGSF